MKNLYTLSLALMAFIGLNAQTFDDDFESYSVGDYVGEESSDWTTWSGATGGAEDAQVVDDNANSGSNSIYFSSSTTQGGPQDVVLPFGGAYETGIFEYEMELLLTSGADAYFNFQAETTIGTTWAMDAYIENGTITLGNTNGTLLTSSMSTGVWVNMRFEINLTNNEWELFIDNVSAGSFSNSINKIASIDIYPLVISGTSSEFWIDDVSYSYTTTTLPTLNALVSDIQMPGLATADARPTVTVRNGGVDDITSFDLSITYDGQTLTESATSISLSSLENYEIEFGSTLTLAAGANNAVATVSNVNGGGADDDPSDDSKTVTFDPVVPADGKAVFIEEATGTWCGWCPRGSVAMARMQETYPQHFIGAAVHNNDPMANADWDAGMNLLISGYPSAVVDRGLDVDPSVMEVDFLERIVMAPNTMVEAKAELDENGEIDVKVKVRIVSTSVTDDWQIAMTLIENEVSGTGSGYAQANYYSGGASGELTGAGHEWHNEPSSVPASSMVYDHVGRVIEPGFAGMANSFPAMNNVGDTFEFDFHVVPDAEWNIDHLHAVGIVIDDAGQVDNAHQVSEIAPYIPTGIQSVELSNSLNVYPNPTTGMIMVQANIADDAKLIVRDMMGRMVYTENLAQKSGNTMLELDLAAYKNGIYMLELQSEGTMSTAKIIKQ